MDKPSSKVGILIFVIVLVLLGGGFAAWKVLGTKEEEVLPQVNEGAELPPITGRTDASSAATEATAQELMDKLLGNNQAPLDLPKVVAVLQTSEEGKALIVERMKNIQGNKGASDTVRAVNHVGRTLVNTSSWTTKAIAAIGKMFGQLHNVEEGNYLTYPIFGKYETKGAPLRAELQQFLDQSWDGYNLSKKRHSGDAHWIGQLSLNLIYGNQNSYLHSPDQIWWGTGDKEGLAFFKAVNGHAVTDLRLLEMKNSKGKKVTHISEINKSGVKGVFSAGVMYAFVKSWMAEMDYFDKVTEQTAIAALIKEGALVKVSKGGKMGATKQ